jgi:hypothetical protein
MVTVAVAQIYVRGIMTPWFLMAIDASALYFTFSCDLVHWTEPVQVDTALDSKEFNRDSFPFTYPSFARVDGSTGDVIDSEGFFLFGGRFGYQTQEYGNVYSHNTRIKLTLGWTSAPECSPPAA